MMGAESRSNPANSDASWTLAHQRQVSGVGAEGTPVLSVLVKREYRWDADSRLCDARDVALVEDPEYSPTLEDELLHDSDLFAFKHGTDIVIHGVAHPPRSTQRFLTRVAVAGREKSVLVLGRRVMEGGRFSECGEAEPTPLSYRDAFGGEDPAELALAGHPLDELRMELKDRPEVFESNPYAYPRNPMGKGFTVRGVGDDGAPLPLFEDPHDLLTPERRKAGTSFDWSRMPIPAGFGWFGHYWFPRCVFFGIVPEVDHVSEAKEVTSGLLDAALFAEGAELRELDPRLSTGASPGLSVPHLSGGESIVLENLSGTHRQLVLEVPRERPRIKCDGRNGKLVEAAARLQTVVIDCEHRTFTVVWCGSTPALRRYLSVELSSSMPFEVMW